MRLDQIKSKRKRKIRILELAQMTSKVMERKWISPEVAKLKK